MTSFLNQKLASAFGQGVQAVQALNESVHTELKVGQHTVLVKERLAEGGFGFVDLVTEVNTKKDYVLKRCNVDREESFATVKKEINILQRFAGKYIVTLVDTDIITKNRTSREALLLLDHCPGGHLLDRLNARGGSHLPAETVYRIFGQLLLALKPMHEASPPITHRDLKLENILFGQDGKLKLIDFGSCVEGPIYMRNAREREAAEEIIAKETTQMYRAPEMCDTYMRQVLTEKTDIWALGSILYALCFLVHPFQDLGSLGILSAKIHFPANSPFSEETHQLILKMLDIDPEARWNIQQLVEGTSALAGGRPLPDIPLSEEAIKRREERIAANTLRESKNQKKVAPVAPPRKVVPLDTNSVAARRLAAKRGVPVGVSTSSPGNDFFDSGSSKDVSAASPVDFTPNFDSAPSHHITPAQQSTSSFATANDLFDDFGPSNFDSALQSTTSSSSGAVRRPSFGLDEPIAPAHNKISNAASLFDTVDEETDPAVATTSSGGFDAFGDVPAAAPVAASSSFDAFGGSSGAFDAFGGGHETASTSHNDFVATSHSDFTPSSHSATTDAFATRNSFTVTDAFASRGSFTASAVTSGGFDAFGAHNSAAASSTVDPFQSSPPIKPKKPKATPQVVDAFAPSVAPIVSGLDVLGVSDEVIHPTSHSSHSHADLFAASSSSDFLSPAPAVPQPTSHSNRNSFAFTGPPAFTDDLLIPEALPPPVPSASSSNRNSLSRDPSAVLSLFDMPKPEKPPKPVMLNTSPAMMMMPPQPGPGGPMYGGGGGGLMMPSPPRPGMMSPPGSAMGGAGGPSMMGGGAGYGPLTPQYGGGMMPPPQYGGMPMQQQQLQSPHYQQRPPPQQQQPSPMAMGGLNNTGLQSQPAFQTQKSVDPFDSINQFSMKRK